jgi:hypothetical protein
MDHNDICQNFVSNDKIADLHIGYSQNSSILFIVIPCISILANLGIILAYFKKRLIDKKNQYLKNNLESQWNKCSSY